MASLLSGDFLGTDGEVTDWAELHHVQRHQGKWDGLKIGGGGGLAVRPRARLHRLCESAVASATCTTNSPRSECQVALEESWKADLAGSSSSGGGECVCCGEAVERQSPSLLVIMASRNNPLQWQYWAGVVRGTIAEEEEEEGKLAS